MITERLMKPGAWDLQLKEQVAYGIWSQVNLYDHIVITPTRFRDVQTIPDSQMLSQSMYTGVVTGQPSPTALRGQGLAYWLATDDGVGDLIDTPLSKVAGTLSQWVSSLRPASILAGTVTSPATTLSYAFQYLSRREALDFVCRHVGAEWRINPNCTLDAASGSNLWVMTPTAVITRRQEGGDSGFQGISATEITQSRNVEGYTTKVFVVGQQGDGAAVTTASASAATSYVDFNNNAVVMERFVDAPSAPASDVAQMATSTLGLYSDVRRNLTLSSRTFAVPIRVRPGDYVYVYDQRAQLYDSANQINWRGQMITPIKLRCRAYTWPVQSGMGVYIRKSGATPTYVDITDGVLFEDGQETQWQVGAHRLDVDQDPTQLNPSYLGAHPQIAARITDPDWVAYTPTLVNVSSGAVTGKYRLRGNKLDVYVAITAGTVTTTGSVVSASLPSGITAHSTGIQGAAGTNGTALITARIGTSGTTIDIRKDHLGNTWSNPDSLASVRINIAGISVA